MSGSHVKEPGGRSYPTPTHNADKNTSGVTGQYQGRTASTAEGDSLIPPLKLQYVAPKDMQTTNSRIVTVCKVAVSFLASGATSWMGYYGLKAFHGFMESYDVNPYTNSSVFIAGSILCCVPAVVLAVRLSLSAGNYLERKFGVSVDAQYENDIQQDRQERARYLQQTHKLLAKLTQEEHGPKLLETTYKTVTVRTAT
ncbi:hypothetical protein [Sansalvadorimonas verongulae]|uniref:hypothetical protein n=1 Tax=Sansalvadorimonas verongulae TaxID=2172824 RepID=UPI0012BC8C25|nr:hypothetical protein [Sansalvadorimonas verongulae]MTI12278.1 hypothetical protein [Sansalvadorimonas verongulae]